MSHVNLVTWPKLRHNKIRNLRAWASQRQTNKRAAGWLSLLSVSAVCLCWLLACCPYHPALLLLAAAVCLGCLSQLSVSAVCLCWLSLLAVLPTKFKSILYVKSNCSNFQEMLRPLINLIISYRPVKPNLETTVLRNC